MKILVTGGREFNNRAFVEVTLDTLCRDTPITSIVHGGARGADTYAMDWARARNIKDIPYKLTAADWERHPGKSAGIYRNMKMLDAEKPDLVVAFPGKNGTSHMIGYAEKNGYKVAKFEPETPGERTFARVPQDGYNHICLLSDGVSPDDIKNGGPLLGSYRQLVEEMAGEAGFNTYECLVTSVFMQPTPRVIEDHFFTKVQAAKKGIKIIEERGPYLKDKKGMFLSTDYDFELSRLAVELHRWRPRVVIALGSVATWATTFQPKLTKSRGSFLLNELTGYGYVLPTYAPSSVHFNKDRLEIIIEDFRAAVKRAKLRLPAWVFDQ